jgi:hypothetical protein
MLKIFNCFKTLCLAAPQPHASASVGSTDQERARLYGMNDEIIASSQLVDEKDE